MKIRSTVSKSVRYGLHFIGIWPGTPFPGLHKFYWISSTIIWQFYQYKYMITHFGTDELTDTIDCLSITLPYTLLIAKLSVAWINHSVLCEMLSTMEEDCVKYGTIDANKVIPKTAEFSYRITSFVTILYLSSASGVAAGNLAFPHFNETVDRQLLLNMDLPFDTNESPTYELVVTAQVLHQMASAYVFGVFSALLVMLILHIGCVIDILCDTLVRISPKEIEKLRLVTIRHQEIIVFADRIEQLFTYIALCQLLLNTLVTCCLGFLAITALKTEHGLPLLLKSSSFYAVLCLEIFIYCFAGEYLNVKNRMIVDAAYQMTWYDLQPNISRQIVFIILKSQKGLPLTFGKFSTLSLESFTGVMKASASYMSVLLAMS
ncbi:odorant receptor 4-like isoform X2 [Halictus rubicundus]|uniref:odorant receptor 4-like isoform X2 n=1 Tax=Halictus rubicundus TaxID=77578 RepID=UPI004034FCEE